MAPAQPTVRPPIAWSIQDSSIQEKTPVCAALIFRDVRMVVFEPHEFIQRLASMIPPPHSHQVRYHGVLASASSLRDLVVPAGARTRRKRRKSNSCWAELMKRAFKIDVLTCPKCKGAKRLIACIMDRKTFVEILGSTGMPGDSPIRRDSA